MKILRWIVLIVVSFSISGCEYAFSDVATRIRYSLLGAMVRLQASGNESMTLAFHPNHWPDACPTGEGYRLMISPYKGGKQVATGDIVVHCDGGHDYYTGLGSERFYVARDLAVAKRPDDELRITLRKTESSVEIVGLE